MQNFNPVFVLTPNCKPITLTAANAASDGSGTIPDLVVAGTNGSRVDQVVFRNAQTTPALSTAMVGRVFVSDTGGANWRLVGEVAIAAATRSSSAVGATSTITFSPAITLLLGQKMGATISIYAGAQDATSVTPFAGDF